MSTLRYAVKGQSTYSIYWENAGLATNYPRAKHWTVVNDPLIWAENNTLTLYMVDIRTTGFTGGGAGTYNLMITLKGLWLRSNDEPAKVYVGFPDTAHEEAWKRALLEPYMDAYRSGKLSGFEGLVPTEALTNVLKYKTNENSVHLRIVDCILQLKVSRA